MFAFSANRLLRSRARIVHAVLCATIWTDHDGHKKIFSSNCALGNRQPVENFAHFSLTRASPFPPACLAARESRPIFLICFVGQVILAAIGRVNYTHASSSRRD